MNLSFQCKKKKKEIGLFYRSDPLAVHIAELNHEDLNDLFLPLGG